MSKDFTEEFKVRSEDLLKRIKQLIKEGNVRRIIIQNNKGQTYLEIPLTIGLIGTALLPIWAAIGALAAVAANFTIKVVRRSDGPAGEDSANSEEN